MMTDPYFIRGQMQTGSGISQAELSQVQELVTTELEQMKLGDLEFSNGYLKKPQLTIDPESIRPSMKVSPPKINLVLPELMIMVSSTDL